MGESHETRYETHYDPCDYPCDDPCDDWSLMPVARQRSLEPMVFWDASRLDYLWLHWIDRYGKPAIEDTLHGSKLRHARSVPLR